MYAHMSTYLRTITMPKLCISVFILLNIHRFKSIEMIRMNVCILYLTYICPYVNFISMTTPAKKKALVASGTLNPHPEAVQSDLFKMDFFDPCDRAQVKYEMLRAHSVDGDPVSEACRQFGFSRESFYQIQQAFGQQGFSCLLPAKRGRKGPIKLKGDMLEFALEKKEENPDIDPGRLAALIRERYGTDIHRTTVMRGIKKKRRSSAERPARGIHRKRGPGADHL
jgi:transposase